MFNWWDCGIKFFCYLVEVIVNDNLDVKYKDESKIFIDLVVFVYDFKVLVFDGIWQKL